MSVRYSNRNLATEWERQKFSWALELFKQLITLGVDFEQLGEQEEMTSYSCMTLCGKYYNRSEVKSKWRFAATYNPT